MAAVIDEGEELARVSEQRRRCEVSRQMRRTVCATYRAWYELGSDSGPESPYNKIWSHLDRLASYVFAPGTVRFGAHLPPAGRAAWFQAADVARDEFRDAWRDSGTDLVAAMLIEWAFVYGSTIGKLQADRGASFRVGYIDPWDFGVSREDVPSLDDQDALAHWYTMSVPQIERWPGVTDRIIDLAHEHASTTGAGRGGRPGLVISGVTGAFPNGEVSGGFPGDADIISGTIEPSVDEPTVTFCDVWERRLFRHRKRGHLKGDEFEDWLVTTTIADHDVIVVQRRNTVIPWTRTARDVALPAELPFVAMRPRPLPNYFWGRSELKGLRKLQAWLDEHRADMRQIVKRELDPARFYTGTPDYEEAGRAMSTPGGSFGSADPGAKMQQLDVKIGDEAFKIDAMIQQAFSDQSGVPESLSEPGSVPGGVRSTGQFSMVAGIGAGRIRKMALFVEDTLGEIATKGFRLLQRHDTTAYPVEGGEIKEFLLSQLPPGITFRVDAHSGAPIFAEQDQAKAGMLHKMGALGPEDAVELIRPSNYEELKIKARGMAQRRGEMAEKKLEIEAAKATRGKRPR